MFYIYQNFTKIKKVSYQIICFGAVGGVATLTHLGIAAGILGGFAGSNEYLANLGGFLGAVWVSYYGHAYFTFRTPGNFKRLFLIFLSGFFINNIVLAFLIEFAIISGWISILISVMFVPVGVFLGLKFWAFAGK